MLVLEVSLSAPPATSEQQLLLFDAAELPSNVEFATVTLLAELQVTAPPSGALLSVNVVESTSMSPAPSAPKIAPPLQALQVEVLRLWSNTLLVMVFSMLTPAGESGQVVEGVGAVSYIAPPLFPAVLPLKVAP